jgi:hypothetical protein
MYRSETGLFHALELVLKQADEPMTCVQIYDDNANIRELAKTPNRVSDYLGGLWRKGQVTRSPAPRVNNSSARWAYAWNNKNADGISQHNAQAEEFVEQFRNAKSVFRKPNVEIFDDGKSLTIELPEFTITVRQKR